jgi:hypothetical protein
MPEIPKFNNFTCSSGNCTWPEYGSLGICSSCEDFSNKAQKTCTPGDEINTIYCDYSLPSEGITLSTVMITPSTNDTAGGTIMNSTVASSGLRPRVLTRIGILRVDEDEYEQMRKHPNNYTDVPKSIHVCELDWCLKEYESAKVNNGVLEESLQTNPPLLQDRIGVFEATMTDCTEQFGYSLSYKVFGVQRLDLQSPRLFDIFKSCPDIMKISEEENVYIVNSNDERYVT